MIIIVVILTVVDPRGGACASPLLPLAHFFFSQKQSLQAKIVLNKYKICLKMLEMAILEIQIFKNFWESMPPDPLESLHLRHSWYTPPPFWKSWISPWYL